MDTLISLIELVTTDSMTMAAASVLALALIGLLLVITWPSRSAESARHASGRPATARKLANSGTPAVEIARTTGLSRDALAIVLAASAAQARDNARRQKSPTAARPSLWQRLSGTKPAAAKGSQVAA